MDVARCISDANLISGDLLPILSLWPENAQDSKYKSRIALACFELMVPLTWPIERNLERMTKNHHRHIPVLELSQVAYKRAIVNYDGARILHSAVRVALSAMAMPIGDRTQRDQGIIKLVLFFLRNIAAIAPPPGVKYDGDESQISRSATIDAFSYQDIFHVLLTLASNMGEDFKTEDTMVMEIIYHLVKRVEIDKMFMNETERNKAGGDHLAELMRKEEAMLQAQRQNRGSRHNRFGTMIWVKRDDGKMATLTGQDAIASASTRQRKMDENKTYKPPRRAKKEDPLDREIGLPPKLNTRAHNQLRSFVEDFLDAGFNPLFYSLRKSLDREAPHVMIHHRRQFFYLIAWFLEAERARKRFNKDKSKKDGEDVTSFNLVAGVLNQEMFITLNRALHEAYEMKDWYELAAVMRCFTQILITVQEMQSCGNEDDEEIAENTLSRLFYEEATHDAIANIIRTYKDQSFDYLDASTELVHHFLRVLEKYSQQNTDMQVRSRKRTRRKKKAAQQAEGAEEVDEEMDGSEDDEANAQMTTKERKFDFHRFAARFTPQGVVDTFIAFTKHYHDLNPTQLKRAHRYLYRVAYKQEASVMLFRVDIIHLLYNMIKGPKPLEKGTGAFKEWEPLVKGILKKMTAKIEERPELIVEMLFSKMGSTAFFLENGFDKATVSSKTAQRPGAELEFKYTEEKDRQIAIVVSVLLDRNQADQIAWLKKVLENAELERRSFEDLERARQMEEDPFDDEANTTKEPAIPPLIFVKPDDDARQTAMFKNSHLRLLMTTAGLQRLSPAYEETRDTAWVIPSEVKADDLKDIIHYINQAEFNPPTFEEGVLAESQLKRKTVPRKRATFDDDEEDGADFLDEEMLFPAGGPTARQAIDAPEKPKKKRSRRKKDPEEMDQEDLDEKARKRRERELEKARKIKSALYVKPGDDEFDSDEDEAFFAREREIAAKAAKAAGMASTTIVPEKAAPKKRKSTTLLSDDSDAADDDEDDSVSVPKVLSSQETGDSETDDTPIDGSDSEGRKKRRRLSPEDDDDAIGEEDNAAMTGANKSAAPAHDDEDDEDVVPVPARKPRIRGGFVIDSDDDE